MLWYRALSKRRAERETQSSLFGDNGPGLLRIKEKAVQYERTKITERSFLDACSGYTLAERGADWFRFQIIRRI